MRIRWKLLILLLGIALVPVVLVGGFENRALRRMGSELGARARAGLIERAGRQLARLVEDYGTIISREEETVELVLRVQARDVLRCLAADPPQSPSIFWAEDYDRVESRPPGMVLSDRHFRLTDDGRREAVPVTYEHQVFKLAPGVARQDVADDVARLSLMTPQYRLLRQGHGEMVYWAYTALTSGVHSSYPGHGGYPPEYDPRRRHWYVNALADDKLTWNPPIVDATTREVMMTVSMPVRGPGGVPVGVTGLDIRLLELLQAVSVPAAWSADARSMLVVPFEETSTETTIGLIIAQRSYLKGGRRWDVPIELEAIESDDEAQLQELIADMQARRSGLRKLPYEDCDCLWAYASTDSGAACILLIVPYDDIIAQAVAAETQVLARTRQQLRTTCLTVGVVAVLVFLIALLGSRAVTRPMAELAETARRIAGGDWSARADIRARDELGEMGRAFNEMIPQLADRLRLRESLGLAMQVQQRLLPAKPPQVAGLDIAGRSIYCDETGGDYYDFLDLSELGPHQLGVAVGDVTGHGIAAALLMATGRALLRCRVHGPGNLAEVISDINYQLTADTAGHRFMTLIYLLIDTRSRALRWVCAGHDPPITYDPGSGNFGELPGGGIPLGITADWHYEEYEAPAPPDGQIIVIGTDGIWETHNQAGEMFGKDALRRIIRENAQGSAEQISLAITNAVAAFRQTLSQADDITLVVIKLLPQNAA